MYIRVTTRCNMECAHCLYACTAKGKDMPVDVFERAVDIAADYDDIVAIGGGEPTLHPKIISLIGYAVMMANDDYIPFMVTNGAMDVELWRKLLRAYNTGKLDLHVSKDPWHDVNMIPKEVWDDADKHKLWWGDPDNLISGHPPKRTIVMRGRAKTAKAQQMLEMEALDAGYGEVSFEEVDCVDARVDPDGYVYVDVTGKTIKVGPLSEDTYEEAKQIASEEEEGIGVSENPTDYRK